MSKGVLVKGLHQVFCGSDALIVGNRTDCEMTRENKSCFMEILLNQNLIGTLDSQLCLLDFHQSPVSACDYFFQFAAS